MKKKRSFWPYAIFTGLSIVFAVNFTFLYFAVTSDDGLEDRDYYIKGLFYDKKIKTERELGWSIDFSIIGEAKADSSNRIKVRISDSKGLPLKDAAVKIILRRPASDRFDRSVGLVSGNEGYTGNIEIPLEGYWDLKVIAGKDGHEVEKTFRVRV